MMPASSQALRFLRPLRLAALAGAVSLSVPATAFQEEDKASILVQGDRVTPAAARAGAETFIRASGVAAGELPAARWTDPVCPVVIGLNDGAKAVAEAEIRRIALEAGAPLAVAPCKENLAVTFTSDAGAVARAISEREPRRLSELSAAARSAVLKGNAPIRWWYSTEKRSRHGVSGGQGMANAGGTGQNSPGSGYGSALPSNGMMHYESSMLSTSVQRVIVSAVVLVDMDGVEGRSLKAVAAHAALVGLAEIRDPAAKPPGSILAMLSAPTPVRGLTRQDKAFLKALYRLPLDRKAQLHRGALVRDMARDMTIEPRAGLR